MRESIFRFKQFSVSNTLSAMKVGTDGVLLGAWCDVHAHHSILDVGAGTGLISLMVAQRSLQADILAIEISELASREADYNFKQSMWSDRLCVVNVDFNMFVLTNKKSFDHVISNPPYFDEGVKSTNMERAIARHTDSLSYKELLRGSFKLLNEGGKLSIITPYDVREKILQIASECGFSVIRMTIVYPNTESIPKRILWELSKEKHDTIYKNITIELSRHIYTPEYIELTKDFYLKM